MDGFHFFFRSGSYALPFEKMCHLKDFSFSHNAFCHYKLNSNNMATLGLFTHVFNPLPKGNILDVTKLKAFADDKCCYNDKFSR